MNDAARAAATVNVLLVLLEPEALVAVRVTVFDPPSCRCGSDSAGSRSNRVPEAPRPRGRRPRRGVRELDRLARRRGRRAVRERGRQRRSHRHRPIVLLDPEALVAVRVTVFDPAVV